MDAAEIYTLVEARRTELGLSQAEVGRRVSGKADTSVVQNLRKGSFPAFDTLEALGNALGLEVYFGRPRSLNAGFSDPSAPALQPPPVPSHDYLPIPWHTRNSQAASCPVSFSYAWMNAHALIPERLSAVVPDCVDLQDHIAGTTLAVIDALAPRRQHFGLWCYSEAGRIHLSRLQFDRGSILIMPDAPTRPPRLLLEGEASMITPLGRVVWMGVVPKE